MAVGTKVMCWAIVFAPLAGTMLFYAIDGGSLAAALVLGVLMSGGIWLVSLVGVRKLGLPAYWRRSRSN